MRKIESRQEMINERGPDDAIDALDSKTGRQLPEGQSDDRQILDGPVAQADRIDARLPDLGLLSARKRALHFAELLEAELFRELRVEPELRTTSIDEEGDFVPAIDAHVDDGQRASVHEFEAGLLAITVQLVRRLALEAPQLRDIQCRVLGFRLFSKTAMRDDQGKRDANADMSHLDSQSKLSRDQTILRH